MINIPKGTRDVLPFDSYKWQVVRDVVNNLKNKYNLHEIITPMFEHTELFVRGVGNSSDIVNKEMYTFLDKGERSLTLKPEGTAGVVRSFIENGLFNETMPLKLFYITSCFRYEKPQAGRFREHHQFGCEMFGADSVEADVETIMLACDFYKAFGINPTVLINNLGCSDCREKYKKLLKEYFSTRIDGMCDDCKKRFETNPLRILDCKVDVCKQQAVLAPKITDVLCTECNTRFDSLKQLLSAMGVNYRFNPMLVRGLDYYTNLIFEFVDDDKTLGQNALSGGGRYNNLVEELGGKPTAVVGFGIGIERLLLYLENKGIQIENKNQVTVYVASVTDDLAQVVKFVKFLRDNNISTEHNISNRSLKAQFKYADKIGAKYVITVGDNELNSQTFAVKELATGKQDIVEKQKIISYLLG